MFFFNRQRDKIYEKLAKPGSQYSVYSNQHYRGEILLEVYLIEEIFQDKSSGFYALGLVSTRKKRPVLVIRGCGNWGDFKDFPREFLPYKDIRDVLITGSDEHFHAAKKVGVIKWLQKQTSLGKKPDLVGQSLGGKVGQQLAIEVPEYIHCLITFNSIGISEAEFKRYKGKVEISHYVNPFDLISYIFGGKFLPGTIWQTYNPNILKADLLNQHNKVVLNDSQTQIKKIKTKTFDSNRDIYTLIRDYSEIIQKNLEELQQSAIKIETASQEASHLHPLIHKNFEQSYQLIQQEFRQMTQAIQQEILDNSENVDSQQSPQQQLITSVEVIQKQIANLSKVVHHELKEGENFGSFSKIFQQNLKKIRTQMRSKFDIFVKK